MGAVADFLQNAAGDVGKGVSAATGAASNAVGMSSMPNMPNLPNVDFTKVPLPSSAISSMQAGNLPQAPNLSLMDLLGQNPQTAPLINNMTNPAINNPYAPDYSQAAPQTQAASVGAPDQSQPITVTGDAWTPPHQEGTLAKIGDFFLGDRFRNRTVQANERDALEHSIQNGQLNPDLALARMERIPGVNPMTPIQMLSTMTQSQFYKQYGQMRQDEAQKSAIGTVSAMFGSQSPIGQMIANGKDPSQMYEHLRPLMETTLQKANVPQDEIDQMLPQTFDPQAAQTVASMGFSAPDQARIALEEQREGREDAAQQQEINLRTTSVAIEQANSNTERARVLMEAAKNDQGTFAQKSTMYQKVLGGAARIPWLYGGFLNGEFGKDTNGMPKPGVAYLSKDGTAAAKMDLNGSWKLYKVNKVIGKNRINATPVYTLPGVLGSAPVGQDNSGDFSQ